MDIHELKTTNPIFEDMWSGLKEFDVRKNDRDFKIGDILKLVEYGETKNYTPRCLLKRISYILKGGQYGISSEYVVLGLKAL